MDRTFILTLSMFFCAMSTDNSTPAVGSTVQTVNYTSNLDSISNDVHIIMFIAVSYTHLDVYKRQDNTCTACP